MDINFNNIDTLVGTNSYRSEPENCNRIISTYFSNSFNILTQNIRSISANFAGLLTLLCRINLQHDLIVLTECWLSRNPYIPPLNGYNHHITNERINQNDGVVVYIKKSIQSVVVCHPSFCDANCILIRIGQEICILAIYRPPSFNDISNFLESLDLVLSQNSNFKQVIIVGDINIDIAEGSKDPKTPDYINLIASHGLWPSHILPTHDRTSLDHTLLKVHNESTTIVIDSTITDHNAVLLSIGKMKILHSTYTVTKTDHRKLMSHLKNMDFSYIYNYKDPNLALEFFVSSINSAISLCSGSYVVPHRLRILKPWITSGVLRCMRNRDRMYKQIKSNPNNELLRLTYKRYRNFCGNLLKNLKQQYYKNQLNLAKKDSRKLWNVIREVTNTTKARTTAVDLLKTGNSPEESVNQVNSFFVNVGKTLASQIIYNPNRRKNLETSDSCHSFVFLDTDSREVETIIDSLRSDSASGIDGISSSFLQQYKSLIVPPFTFIINLCISKGVFPDLFKKALIHPIHKSGKRDRVNHYRPISVLPAMSKVLERIMNTRLKKFLEDNKLLSDAQYGFRNKKSTNDAVYELTETIVGALDKKMKCIAIFLDLAKAFDTVSIPRLISKLERIGVRGSQLNFFKSYLNGRTQRVRIGDFTSNERPVDYGVPQGSILGPTLFLVYVNAMCNLKLESGKLIAFADDTALIFTTNSWCKTFEVAQNGFNQVTDWLSENSLSLNVDKTKFLTFSNRRLLTFSDEHYIAAHIHTCSEHNSCSCARLSRMNSVKYLGVIIDYRLTFIDHIESLTNRVRKLIYLFKQLRSAAEPNTLKMVYFSLCQAVLGYCIGSWGGASRSHLIGLERAQRAVLKVCTFKHFRFPTQELYEYCQVLTVRQLFILQTILKVHSSCIPNPQSQVKRTCIIQRKNICHTSLAQRFYYFLGSYLYNKANNFLSMERDSVHTCKQKLKSWLSSLSYNDTETLLKPLV